MDNKVFLVAALLLFSLGCMGYEIKKTESAPSMVDKGGEYRATSPPTLQAPIDSDRDGLTDLEEKSLGTNPHASDSDNDGLSDYIEIRETNTNPFKSDSDGDGLNDLEEKNLGTKPLLADSDNDGLSDFVEIKETKTEPLKFDTDGDGLRDGEEIQAKTNAFVPDTDGDGLNDYQEVKVVKSDPLKLNTDGDRYNDGQDPNPTEINSANIEIKVVKNDYYLNEDLRNQLKPLAACLILYAAESSFGEITGFLAQACTYILAGTSLTTIINSDFSYRDIEIQAKNIGNDYTSYVNYKIDVYVHFEGKPEEHFDSREVKIGTLKPNEVYTYKIKYTWKVKDYTVGMVKKILDGSKGDRVYRFGFSNLEYEKF